MLFLQGLSKQFGAITALDDFNLEIQDGEFITLLGPSGCGKTTALRIIAGQETPTTGRVFIDGKDITDLPAHKRPVNMVFQSYALFPHMSIYENIAFGPALRKEPEGEIRRNVGEILSLVRLEGFEERRVTQLSGGQAQRVALARALINRPKVLLLDEPLGALDLKLRKQMQLELKSLNRQINTTFVYVTHDQEEALTMSDRIVVMNQGRIIQVGSARQIYERPNSTFVSTFVGETNLLQGKVLAVKDGEATVDMDGLALITPIMEGVQAGQVVYVSIRPDAVLIGAPGMGEQNVVEAQVLSSIFLGTLMKYELRLPNGQVISAQNSQTQAEGVYPAEHKLPVKLPVDKMVVLTS